MLELRAVPRSVAAADLDALAALVHQLHTDLTPLVACAELCQRLPLPPVELAVAELAVQASARTIEHLDAITALVARVR